ncbi:MAG: hypothetical protein NC826_06470 [Candidatus Omnitrophica bacterium]|nr:hypothetical protein [Candidatus Omnitrophota bacterium]
MIKRLIFSIIIFLGLISISPSDLFAETFQLNLKPGVNYISIPIGKSWKIKDILSQISATSKQVAFWDTVNSKYIYFVDDPDFDQFSTFEFGRGYWIYLEMASSTTINLTETTPINYNLPLKKGWNAIGCPKTKEMPVEAALLPLRLGVDYASVWRYAFKDYPWYQQYSQKKKEFTHLKPGEGYWIRMLKDVTWVINPDTTPPKGTVKVNNDAKYTNSTSVILTLSATDLESGMGQGAQMQFSNDNINWSIPEAYATIKSWTLLTGDGEKRVYVKFKDKAGNWSQTYSDSIILDTTPPTGTVKINNDAQYTSSTSVTLTLSATDSASGISQMQFSNGGTNWSTPEAYTPTKTWTLTSGEGVKTVYVKFSDKAGNWSQAYSDTIILDTSPPSTPIVTDNGQFTNSTTQLHATWTSSDPESKISEYCYRITQDSISGIVIVDWTSTGSANEITKDGLNLINKKTYYFGVQAKNGAGIWSKIGYSDGITVEVSSSAPILNPIGNKNIFVQSSSKASVRTSISLKTTSARSILRENQRLTSKKTPQFKPGEIIIKFNSDIVGVPAGKRIAKANEIKINVNSIQALNKKFGLLSAERIFKEDEKRRLEYKLGDLTNVYLFKFPIDADVEVIVKEYRKDPNVEYVEPNYIMWIMGEEKLPSKKIFKEYK